MEKQIVFAGFGGQGALFAAQLLAYAAMIDGKQVAWIPSYGPEMRGGTASAAVVIADEKIGSLSVSEPDVVAVLNAPSLDKYEPMVKSGGCIVVNRSLITRPLKRGDVVEVNVRANELAAALGRERLFNMIVLGTVVGVTGLVRLEAIEDALAKTLTGKKSAMIGDNLASIRKGIETSEQLSLVGQGCQVSLS